MRKYMKLSIVALIVALFVITTLLVAASPGAATPATGVATSLLARATVDRPAGIPFDRGTDVVMAVNTFDPGGSSGWHSHPGGAIVLVKQGELTLYRSFGNHCEATTYRAGEAFFERPSDVQNGVNQGTTTTIAYVTFPSVPAGGPSRIDQPDPGC